MQLCAEWKGLYKHSDLALTPAVIVSVTLSKSFNLHEPQFSPVTKLISGEKTEQGCDGSQKPSFLLRGLREKEARKTNGERKEQ